MSRIVASIGIAVACETMHNIAESLRSIREGKRVDVVVE